MPEAVVAASGVFYISVKMQKSLSKRTGIMFDHLDSAGNFTGTQAPGTNIHMARRTIDQSLHALDIGLPGTIGTSVGMGNLDTEGYALVAEFALSHPLHLLAVTNLAPAFASI